MHKHQSMFKTQDLSQTWTSKSPSLSSTLKEPFFSRPMIQSTRPTTITLDSSTTSWVLFMVLIAVKSAHWDPPYSDPSNATGSYKGKLQCGVYKPVSCNSNSVFLANLKYRLMLSPSLTVVPRSISQQPTRPVNALSF